MTVDNTVVVKECGCGIMVFVVFVEPVVRLKMAEGNPQAGSLKSWVLLDCLFDSMFMVALKTKPSWSLILTSLGRYTHTIHSFIVHDYVFLVILSNNSLWTCGIVSVQRPHISTIPKVYNVVRVYVVDQSSQPVKPFVVC